MLALVGVKPQNPEDYLTPLWVTAKPNDVLLGRVFNWADVMEQKFKAAYSEEEQKASPAGVHLTLPARVPPLRPACVAVKQRNPAYMMAPL